MIGQIANVQRSLEDHTNAWALKQQMRAWDNVIDDSEQCGCKEREMNQLRCTFVLHVKLKHEPQRLKNNILIILFAH